MQNNTRLTIDIWSDVICPFCYIGKRRLEMALARTEIEADIEWHSFELNPDAPLDYRLSLQSVLMRMYGMGEEQVLAVLHHEEETARSVGLDFAWQKARPSNTFDAHRLLHLAKEKGLANEAKERFFRAYFTEGALMSDKQTLQDLALEIGLPKDEVESVLNSDRFGDDVRYDERMAGQLGIRGVPYFIINDDQVISGAQDLGTFMAALLQAKQNANQQNSEVVSDQETSGAACGINGCDIT